eukprot:g54117.t1
MSPRLASSRKQGSRVRAALASSRKQGSRVRAAQIELQNSPGVTTSFLPRAREAKRKKMWRVINGAQESAEVVGNVASAEVVSNVGVQESEEVVSNGGAQDSVNVASAEVVSNGGAQVVLASPSRDQAIPNEFEGWPPVYLDGKVYLAYLLN